MANVSLNRCREELRPWQQEKRTQARGRRKEESPLDSATILGDQGGFEKGNCDASFTNITSETTKHTQITQVRVSSSSLILNFTKNNSITGRK